MRTDPRPTRQTDTRADTLLQQLHECGQRRARVQDIAPDLRTRLTDLLALIPTMPAYGNASAVVQGASERLAEAWRTDALQMIAKRDVEVVRSFVATVTMQGAA
jgi:hypothetical protein